MLRRKHEKEFNILNTCLAGAEGYFDKKFMQYIQASFFNDRTWKIFMRQFLSAYKKFAILVIAFRSDYSYPKFDFTFKMLYHCRLNEKFIAQKLR